MSVELHYSVEGPPGAPVVLLHNSLGASLAMWDAQVPALAQHYRVLRYDGRGHGRSPAPPGPYTIADLAGDAVALLDRLDVERAHMVGLSLGGMLAMHIAATTPDRVDRMVLCCTSAYLPPARNWHDRAAAVRAEGIAAIAESVVARWVTPGFAAASPDVVRDLRAMLEATSDEGYASSAEAIATMDLRTHLRHIHAPTLVVAGSDDPATPADHARTIAAEVPHARLVIVEPAAHLAAVEQPAAVTEHVLNHLSDGTAP